SHHASGADNSKVYAGTAAPFEAGAAVGARQHQAYGELPLSFEANLGQSDQRVKFLSRGRDHTLFLTSTEMVLVLKNGHPRGQARKSLKGFAAVKQTEYSRVAALRMRFIGANTTPRIVGLEKLPGVSRYFIGNDPKRWYTYIPTYAKIKYEELYPGVDLVYYGNRGRLEYDFIVAPRANPSVIRLAFKGAEQVRLDDDGNLILTTAGVEIRLEKPFAYQENHGLRIEVPCRYLITGEQQVTLRLAAYDPNLPLIIDPSLSYSTYLGGSGTDSGEAIAIDSGGNADVTGSTGSTNFPSTAGAFQIAKGGGTDAFVIKLNSAGTGIIYSTYLGGSGDDSGSDIAVDFAGNAYVTGTTLSDNFPTVNAIQGARGGLRDAFVTKLNSNGTAPLVYSTYLGGNGDDFGNGLVVDSSGNAYVTGSTTSINFPTRPTVGPLQGSLRGPTDAFVSKLNASGASLVYSTYLGGSSDDTGADIAIDSSGNAYITGNTTSLDFPTVSPLPGPSGVLGDAFVTKLNGAGTALIYSTYLGGSQSDVGNALTVDSLGNAYVTGSTASTIFPVTPGVVQGTTMGSGDAFVTKLNANGNGLVYSTYLGGSGGDVGTAIALDSSGSVHINFNYRQYQLAELPDTGRISGKSQHTARCLCHEAEYRRVRAALLDLSWRRWFRYRQWLEY
ncbi:MAG: hypothetical protein C4293_03540, partial [Nitrospiraceae bacterium]